MTAAARLPETLPDWPRLMSEPMAASYLGIGTTTLRESGIARKHIGRRVVYDRRELDRYADALDGQPLDDREREAEAGAVNFRVKERLRGR